MSITLTEFEEIVVAMQRQNYQIETIISHKSANRYFLGKSIGRTIKTKRIE